jgi:hypothetical protein
MNRVLEYLDLTADAAIDLALNPKPTKLSPFICIYQFQGKRHNIIIYAQNWENARSYAQYHGMVVVNKIDRENAP